ncbi:hypothetical protein [Massilia sp. SYSU DXS3249]
MNQNPAFDSSIPVLTEVVLEPMPAELEPAAELAAAEPVPAEAAPAEPVPAPAPEPDWDALERRIAERIVAQLQPQLDAIVRNALASAGDQIHIGLRQAVEQMVAQQIAAVQK